MCTKKKKRYFDKEGPQRTTTSSVLSVRQVFLITGLVLLLGPLSEAVQRVVHSDRHGLHMFLQTMTSLLK